MDSVKLNNILCELASMIHARMDLDVVESVALVMSSETAEKLQVGDISALDIEYLYNLLLTETQNFD